jgi:SAM-dependent methyltransferase
MCNTACLEWVASVISEAEIKGATILESGAFDVNGSARSLFEQYKPKLYIGTDIKPGRGVDQICAAEDLFLMYGRAFDVVLSTEVIEHVRDWRAVIDNYKRVLRPFGLLIITTRSLGFPYHEHPEDHWRYELSDMPLIFKDFEIVNLNTDESAPGVFIKARKPKGWKAADLSKIALYKVVAGQEVERSL